MRNWTLLLTLCLLLAHVSPSCGDWFYDFDDSVVPDSLVIEGFRPPWGTPTDTLHAGADDQALRVWDAIPGGVEGSSTAIIYDREAFDGDVRVSAEINAARNSNDHIGVAAGYSEPLANSSHYVAFIAFDPSIWDYGRLYVRKILPGGTSASVSSPWQIPAANQSYFIELDVIDDPTTDFLTVTGRLFNEEGGTLLTEISMTDTNLAGTPPVRSGFAGFAAWTNLTDTLDSTFDNVRAEALAPYLLGDMNLDGAVNGLDVDPFVEAVVDGAAQPTSPFVAAVLGSETQLIPEPSTLLLCVIALGAGGGWRKWKHAA